MEQFFCQMILLFLILAIYCILEGRKVSTKSLERRRIPKSLSSQICWTKANSLRLSLTGEHTIIHFCLKQVNTGDNQVHMGLTSNCDSQGYSWRKVRRRRHGMTCFQRTAAIWGDGPAFLGITAVWVDSRLPIGPKWIPRYFWPCHELVSSLIISPSQHVPLLLDKFWVHDINAYTQAFISFFQPSLNDMFLWVKRREDPFELATMCQAPLIGLLVFEARSACVPPGEASSLSSLIEGTQRYIGGKAHGNTEARKAKTIVFLLLQSYRRVTRVWGILDKKKSLFQKSFDNQVLCCGEQSCRVCEWAL